MTLEDTLQSPILSAFPPPDGVVGWAGVGVFFAGGEIETVAVGFRFRGVLCLRDCCLGRCCECYPLRDGRRKNGVG